MNGNRYRDSLILVAMLEASSAGEQLGHAHGEWAYAFGARDQAPQIWS